MSIYSGFATRQQESFYNKIALRAMEMLSDRLIAFIRSDPFDEEAWYYHLRKIYKYMEILEAKKYLPPKFSSGVSKLIKHYKKYMNLPDSNSTMTSKSFFLSNELRELNQSNGVLGLSETPHNDANDSNGMPPSMYFSNEYSGDPNKRKNTDIVINDQETPEITSNSIDKSNEKISKHLKNEVNNAI
jgi:hypothetical protein